MALTGKDVSDLMASHQITFSVMRLRYQCILGQNIQQGAFRKLLKDESPLPSIVTREALFYPHSFSQSIDPEELVISDIPKQGKQNSQAEEEDAELFQFGGFKN